MRSRRGSSPLARGLRRRTPQRSPADRIIPARAGFTPTAAPKSPASTDHPRSRGVYEVVTLGTSGSDGSSPLARGLRGDDLQGRQRYGIIPARAGFTALRRPSSGRCRDHPRSRGVYTGGVKGRDGKRGSSPLARGLRDPAEISAAPTGIIPARAGFTGEARCRARWRPDHPRSRGVYCRRWRRSLAGLRIIPARAGFTGHHPQGGVRQWDHPRSRGVYPRVQIPPARPEGSSPLARGLRVNGWWSRKPAVDHPRSRGVYLAVTQGVAAGEGSSPLARGLRGSALGGLLLVRIIPARAGFTSNRPSARCASRDHPRSRGVY